MEQIWGEGQGDPFSLGLEGERPLSLPLGFLLAFTLKGERLISKDISLFGAELGVRVEGEEIGVGT